MGLKLLLFLLLIYLSIYLCSYYFLSFILTLLKKGRCQLYIIIFLCNHIPASPNHACSPVISFHIYTMVYEDSCNFQQQKSLFDGFNHLARSTPFQVLAHLTYHHALLSFEWWHKEDNILNFNQILFIYNYLIRR